MNRIALIAIALAFASTAACGSPAGGAQEPRSAHDLDGRGGADHEEAPDPRLEDPAVIAAAARVKVLPARSTPG